MRRLIGLLICCLVCPAWAVKTSHWTHTSESDFRRGTFEHVVATNLGDLRLSRQIEWLASQDPHYSAIFSLAQAPDGTIYAGTGPDGALLAIKDKKVTTAAEFGEHVNVFSLLVDSRGRLLVGTGGDKGEILRINKPGDKPESVFSAEGVNYVWAIQQTSDGLIYAATGPNGQLFQINPDGSNKVLLDISENNLLCLTSDDKDNLYFGTDPNGLVYRVNRKSGEAFIMYDAAEDEVCAIARDAKGNLYVGTADSTEADDHEAPPDELGRPQDQAHETPIPSQPRRNPRPPEAPATSPDAAAPIPRQTRPLNLMVLTDADEQASPTSAPGSSAKSARHPAAAPPPKAEPSGGNAIYRIDPDGFVTEVFRRNESVLALAEQNGVLYAATGDKGNVYQINPDADENTVIAKTDAKQVMCLLPAKDGSLFLGTANAGMVGAMGSGFANSGTYTSAVLDADQISRFGKIQLLGNLPAGTSLKIATRSGNVEQATDSGWSKWSDELPANEFVQTTSPAARFFQYRLTFASADGKGSAIVNSVDVAYSMPNLPPVVKSIKISSDRSTDADSPPTTKLTIKWDADDPNEDDLEYTLYFRNGSNGPWIVLKDKLKDPTFDWETRNVGDGRYQIKVEATDAPANPLGQGKSASRISEPVVVDNTPPTIGDVKTTVNGANATIALRVVDRTSTVALLQYCVDSADHWQSVLPSDNIADSPDEAYEFVVPGLSVGAHQITLRATDSHGNRAFESVSATVK